MGLFARATGRLGWTPDEFWKAQLWEVRLALEGHYKKAGREDSRHAAWIINTTGALLADDWDRVAPTDLFDPEYEPPTREEIEEERQALAEEFPATLE
jgi:hypothetical protein